jgi:hypothetical protein
MTVTAAPQVGQQVRVTGCIREAVPDHQGQTGRLIDEPCVGGPHLHVQVGPHTVCCTTSVEDATPTREHSECARSISPVHPEQACAPRPRG